MIFECFHVARALSYNPYQQLVVGSSAFVGEQHNPFFGFYERPRHYPVTLADGRTIQSPAMTFLRSVQSGAITTSKLPDLAVEVANHYFMLVREVVTEEVRRRVNPELPSRQTCLWASDTPELAMEWAKRLGGDFRVLRMEVDGHAHIADATLLVGDSEPLSETYRNAERYWSGEITTNPERELLVSGRVTVRSEL